MSIPRRGPVNQLTPALPNINLTQTVIVLPIASKIVQKCFNNCYLHLTIINMCLKSNYILVVVWGCYISIL